MLSLQRMSFIYPAFLFGLLAISIPILIHLFNFRKYKVVFFSNVKFLKEIKHETTRKNKLRHLLVLLSRILLITFLVLAFAQPVLTREKIKIAPGARSVVIYIDNSFSMESGGGAGTVFDDAREIAREIIAGFNPSDRFAILTNEFLGQHQHLSGPEDVLQYLDQINTGPAVKSMPRVFSRISDLLKDAPAGTKTAYILSDFQKNICEFDKLKADTSVIWRLIPVKAQESGNLVIDSVYFNQPIHQVNQADEITFRIKNYSDKDLENQPLRVYINGQPKAPATFSISAWGEKSVSLQVVPKEAGFQEGKAELSDSPVTYDNDFWFNYEVTPKIRVLAISESVGDSSLKSLKALFEDSLFGFSVMDLSSLDFSRFPEQNLIILSGLKRFSSGLSAELKKFIQESGSLVFFPPTQPDIESTNDFLKSLGGPSLGKMDTTTTPCDRIFFEHPFFEDVFEKKPSNPDLPKVSRRFPLQRSVRSLEEVLLQLRTGDPLLAAYPGESGYLYAFSVPLNPRFSNLSRHGLFVPLMLQMALRSVRQSALYYFLGQNDLIPLRTKENKTENMLVIKGRDNFEVIPEIKTASTRRCIMVHDQISKAGNFLVGARSGPFEPVSFNYDRRESDTRVYEVSEIEDLALRMNPGAKIKVSEGKSGLGARISAADSGKPIWKYAIILALIFLLFETLLLRFWK
jgi:hypothetical protein